MPIVYVNDNFGQWRSDFRHTVAHCAAAALPGHASRAAYVRRRDYWPEAEALRVLQHDSFAARQP
jgi:hypothetical protein